jgi:hypothetical protein
MAIVPGAPIQAIDFNDNGLQSLGITAGTGWTLGTATYRRFGPMLHMTATFTRTGATITGGANSDISNSHLGTVDDADLFPQTRVWFYAECNGLLGGATISDAGSMLLVALHTTAAVASGNVVTLSTSWTIDS